MPREQRVHPNPKFSTAKAPRTPREMAYLGEANEIAKGPRSRGLRSSVKGSEHRILGDLGVMAV
jgi:hypothetical protein